MSARPIGLAGEALRSAVARPVATVATALVVGVVCLVVLLTTGRSAAAEHAVLAKLDSMGSRVVVVYDNAGSAGMGASSLAAVSSIDSVTWALGLGPVRDAHNANLVGGAASVPARPVYGDLKWAVNLELGRWPRAGEAIAAAGAAAGLGLVDGVGAVGFGDGAPAVPVVGTYRADGALGSVAESALIAASPGAGVGPGAALGAGASAIDQPLFYIYVMAASVAEVDSLAASIASSITAQMPQAIEVETAGGLTALREDVAAEMGSSSRYLMLTTLGVGLVLVMITMFAAVAERRRDYGRRRALGASRSAVVGMVLIQACTAGLAGAILGCGAGLLLAGLGRASVPPLSFVAGVGVLALVTTTVAALPPAWSAARRDPVRVLRVA